MFSCVYEGIKMKMTLTIFSNDWHFDQTWSLLRPKHLLYNKITRFYYHNYHLDFCAFTQTFADSVSLDHILLHITASQCIGGTEILLLSDSSICSSILTDLQFWTVFQNHTFTRCAPANTYSFIHQVLLNTCNNIYRFTSKANWITMNK